VLDFVAPFEELIQRFSGRRICPVDGQTYHVVYQPPVQPGICDQHKVALITRPDDAPEVVQRRLEVYRERTAPLEAYYRERNLLYVIDANAEPETVFGRVIETVEAIRKRWKLTS
ncbi:MAG: hypothetical protein RMJ43_09025, partial [Chloroherpetonaceae bacterium]|nr:adenylate kinase [Chthonomonadaceae bacterium]MDW8207964.1 hypothetical protein [Chloroherpetonaceae bacterium]